MSDTISKNDKLKHLIDTDRQVLVNIQFADRKASIYLTISGAILAFLVNTYPITTMLGLYAKPESVGAFIVLTFAYLSTILAIIFLSCVIWPRGYRGQTVSGYFDPNRIKSFGCTSNYFYAYQREADDRLIEDMCELLFQRSTTDAKKFKWLKRGIALSFVAWGFVAITFLIVPTQKRENEQAGINKNYAAWA